MDKTRTANGHKLVEQGAPEEKRSVRETLSPVEVIERTVALLGGANSLYEWTKKDDRNHSAFWVSIFPRLLALEVRMIHENEVQRDAERETENHAHARH